MLPSCSLHAGTSDCSYALRQLDNLAVVSPGCLGPLVMLACIIALCIARISWLTSGSAAGLEVLSSRNKTQEEGR